MNNAWRRLLDGWTALAWPGRLGLVALGAGLLWAAVLGPAREADLATLQAQVRAQRTAALQLRAAKGQEQTPALPADAAFQRAFPLLAERETRLLVLWQQAREHGIEPQRSEFRLSDEAGLGLLRYRINWPVTGSYVQLRGLVDAALAADRALALDSIELTRSDEQPGLLKAQLAWSMWMRRGGAEVAP